MSTNRDEKSDRFSRIPILAAAALITTLVAAPSPVEAHGSHKHHGNHEYHGSYKHPHRRVVVDGCRYGCGVGMVSVPVRIATPDLVAYRPWYAGQVFYAPHHHAHVVYRFPVWVDGAVVYRPYSYCGDHVFVGATVPLPRLAIGIEFGRGVRVGVGAVVTPGYAVGYAGGGEVLYGDPDGRY